MKEERNENENEKKKLNKNIMLNCQSNNLSPLNCFLHNVRRSGRYKYLLVDGSNLNEISCVRSVLKMNIDLVESVQILSKFVTSDSKLNVRIGILLFRVENLT